MNLSFKNKAVGFYMSLATAAMSLVTAIVYVVSYSASLYMSWFLFVMLLLSVAAGVALLLTNKFEYYASVALAVFLVCIGAFVFATFNYMVDAYVGIDVTSLSAGFVGCVVLLILDFVLAFVCNLFRISND